MKRLYVGLIAAIAVLTMATAVYAAVSLSIAATATITAGTANLFLASVPSATSTCPALGSIAYTDTGLSMPFGSVAQGQTTHQYTCVENTGAVHTFTVSITGLPATTAALAPTVAGSPLSGTIINGGTTALIDWPLAINPNAPTGPISFTITVS